MANYPQYLKSTHWQVVRDQMRRKQPFCQRCGSAYQLNVHHVSYERVGTEKFEDLVVLCRPCHQLVHDGDVQLGSAEVPTIIAQREITEQEWLMLKEVLLAGR